MKELGRPSPIYKVEGGHVNEGSLPRSASVASQQGCGSARCLSAKPRNEDTRACFSATPHLADILAHADHRAVAHHSPEQAELYAAFAQRHVHRRNHGVVDDSQQ